MLMLRFQDGEGEEEAKPVGVAGPACGSAGAQQPCLLLTLIALLGIEVLVDWNQTLVEINVLRDQVRLKGMNYAGLLARSAVEPILSSDRAMLTRLATGILDDEDAIYIRITDPSGRLIFEQLDADFAAMEARRGLQPFPRRYEHFLARDARGVTQDFVGFRERLAQPLSRLAADLERLFEPHRGPLFAAAAAPRLAGPHPVSRPLAGRQAAAR